MAAWATLIAVEEGVGTLEQPAGQPGCTLRHLLAHAGGYGFDPDRLDTELARLGAPAPGEPIDPAQSVWRCRGSDLVEPTSRLIAGLPGPEIAAKMVLGSGQPGGG